MGGIILVAIASIALNLRLYIWHRKEEIEWEMKEREYIKKIYLITIYGARSSRAPIKKELLEAAKYAMVHAHPDNGGNQEDFIKFRDIYQKAKEAAG